MNGIQARRRTWQVSFAVALALVLPSVCAAVDGPHLTLTPFVGYMNWDQKVNLEDKVAFGGRLGLMFGPVGIEGHYARGSFQTQYGPWPWTALGAGADSGQIDMKSYWYGISAMAQLYHNRRLSPYITGGWMQTRFDPRGAYENSSDLRRNGFSAGGGVLVKLMPRLHLRLEARDVIFRFNPQSTYLASTPPVRDYTNNMVYSGGLTFSIGGHVRGQAEVHEVAAAPVESVAPPPPPSAPEEQPAAPPVVETETLKDIFFDFDRSDIRADQRPTLDADGTWMLHNATAQMQIEGHCDERGTEEYNIALGDRRAQSAKAYLVTFGVPASRLTTISYGEDRPLDPGHNEEAWAKNRRCHFVVTSH